MSTWGGNCKVTPQLQPQLQIQHRPSSDFGNDIIEMELVTNSVCVPELVCNNKGIEFTQGYADIPLAQVEFYDLDKTVQGKLVPLLHKHSQDNGCPVFAVQVTEFSCGGILLGCTFNHLIADGFSGNMFYTFWAKISRSESINSLIPSFTRSILCPRDPPAVNNLHLKQSSEQADQQTNPLVLGNRIYHISAMNIEKLQATANEKGMKFSKLEAFSAYLWKLLVTIHSEEMNYSKIGIAIDGRFCLMKLGLPANYFGNVVAFGFAVAAAGEVKNKPLSWGANLIHDGIYDAANEEYLQDIIDLVELTKTSSSTYKITNHGQSNGTVLQVSSGLRFPLNGIDYGWGKPILASFHFPAGSQLCYVMPLPSPQADGSWL
ncbi:hypothetical protein KI387_033963, partial [Taxus chinensis]